MPSGTRENDSKGKENKKTKFIIPKVTTWEAYKGINKKIVTDLLYLRLEKRNLNTEIRPSN